MISYMSLVFFFFGGGGIWFSVCFFYQDATRYLFHLMENGILGFNSVLKSLNYSSINMHCWYGFITLIRTIHHKFNYYSPIYKDLYDSSLIKKKTIRYTFPFFSWKLFTEFELFSYPNNHLTFFVKCKKNEKLQQRRYKYVSFSSYL